MKYLSYYLELINKNVKKIKDEDNCVICYNKKIIYKYHSMGICVDCTCKSKNKKNNVCCVIQNCNNKKLKKRFVINKKNI